MKRKKLIRYVDKLRQTYRLSGEGGVFEIVSVLSGLSKKTVQTYYYCEKSRPYKKGRKNKCF